MLSAIYKPSVVPLAIAPRRLGGFLTFGHHHAAGSSRNPGFGNEHLRHQKRAGRGHDHGAQQVFGLDPEGDVGGHDAARNVRHTAGHHGHQFGVSEVGKKRKNRLRRFRLAHENAGRHVQRFRAAHSHEARHKPGRRTDDDLHNADVIKHGKQSADEDHGRQYLKCKIESQMRALLSEIAKHKLRSGKCVTEHGVHGISGLLKKDPAHVHFENKKGEHNLQAKPPADRLQADRLAVGGKNVAERQHRDQAENACKSSH